MIGRTDESHQEPLLQRACRYLARSQSSEAVVNERFELFCKTHVGRRVGTDRVFDVPVRIQQDELVGC